MIRNKLFAALVAVMAMAGFSAIATTTASASMAVLGAASKTATNSETLSKVHYRPYYHRHRWRPIYDDYWYNDWYYRPCYWDSYIGRRVCVNDYGYSRRRARIKRRVRRNRRR